MSGPLGQFALFPSFSLPLCSHTHTFSDFLLHSLCLQFSISPDFFFFSLALWHPSLLIPLLHILTSGHFLTAMMTSFSGLRGVSLLVSLNGSLWWPRYCSQSPQSSASEDVFNITISLTSPQVVDWTQEIDSPYVFLPFSFSQPYSLICLPHSRFLWSPAHLMSFPSLPLVSLPWVDLTWELAWQVHQRLRLNAAGWKMDFSFSSPLKVSPASQCPSTSLSFVICLAVSFQSQAPLYRFHKAVFNLNIRLPSPPLIGYMNSNRR